MYVLIFSGLPAFHHHLFTVNEVVDKVDLLLPRAGVGHGRHRNHVAAILKGGNDRFELEVNELELESELLARSRS